MVIGRYLLEKYKKQKASKLWDNHFQGERANYDVL